MGMDFLTAGLWIKPGVTLNFEAGKQAALALPDDELTAVAGQCGLIDGETDDEIREHVTHLVDTLKEAFDESREFALWVTPDKSFHLWITGGMSSGDSPTDMYNTITDLYEAPSVLKALGFHMDTVDARPDANAAFRTEAADQEHSLAEKCKRCHLFIEHNIDHDTDPELAEYLHLHRGDAADESLDDHDAEPSGMIASLATWKAYGPREMRARFHDYLHPVPDGTPRIIARMQPQAWVDDNAVKAGNEIKFDITAQVLEMGRRALVLKDSSDSSDALWATAVERAEVEPHRGPFFVICEDVIREFFGEDQAG